MKINIENISFSRYGSFLSVSYYKEEKELGKGLYIRNIRGGDEDSGDFLLAEMLEVLSETDRQIVLLRCQQELPFREIAQRCGIKETAARKRFERARKAMIKQKGVTSYEQLFSL